MQMNLEETFMQLWSESQVIEQNDGTPRHLAFAKRVRDRTLNEACSIVCFYCRDEVPAQKSNSGIWQHFFFGEDKKVRDRTECKAAAIREIM